jgi:RND superfamily putative drug exporter
LISSPHPKTQEIFVATNGDLAGKVTRFDLILDYDPFSEQASEVLEKVETFLHKQSLDEASAWHGTTFAFSGTVAGIRDLKLVTQSDNQRIQILVILAVLAVLLAILKKPLVCIYMILTVLFSYYVTIGTTEWFFAWLDGPEFRGLDWKVPLFLFVILVAIGQDYNVYLATRVFEEQQRWGPIKGLHYAVVRTGGIITSCGIIMAGTFSSMTSGDWGRFMPAWVPGSEQLFGGTSHALPAIVQLGFALTLGVMLDTFVVRPILVPAFLALLCRLKRSQPDTDSPDGEDEQQQSGPHKRSERPTSFRVSA